MSEQVGDPKMREKLLEQTVAQQVTQIKTLKAAIRTLVDEDTDDDMKADMDAGGEDSDQLLSPDWDVADSVYRCLDCKFEVVEGVCQHCEAEYNWDPEDEEHPQGSMSIENEAIKDDRRLAPRASTPLWDVSPSRIPEEYSLERNEEFYELLKRGATCLMCETFHLSFTHETGIIAWADGDIFDTFSGPAMQNGDKWKIHLGRCIELDDEDYDGSIFLEGLLEDVLFFPMTPYINGKVEFGYMATVEFGWETVEETPGIWVTRPTPNDGYIESSDIGSDDDFEYEDFGGKRDDESLSGCEDVTEHPVLFKDRYESSSDEAESDIEMTSDAENEAQDNETPADSASVDSGTLEDDSSSSSDDSDFDSDDMFSGDERAALDGMKLLEWQHKEDWRE